MCSEVLDELTLLFQELQRTLSPQALQQLAKKVGFVQRTSKYQAKDLIALCVWLSQKVGSTSLTQLCSSLESSTGVLISPEGLNQRFTVSYPGKIVTYEDMYATVPAGAKLPFKASVSVGSLKYYKDGSYVFTHSLPLAPSYIKNPADLADFKCQ